MLWDILEQEVDRELLYIAEDIEELVIEDGNVYYDTLELMQEVLSLPRFPQYWWYWFEREICSCADQL